MAVERAPQKPPAFQFYAKDFLNGTATMSLSEVGAYIRLLAWSWDNGPLPLEERQIARIAHATIGELRRVWNVVGTKFVRAERGWINERLERQRHELAQFTAMASDRGKAGAEKRWKKHASSIAPSTAQVMQDPMQNDSSPICDLQTAVHTPKDPACDRARETKPADEGPPISPAPVAWRPRAGRPVSIGAVDSYHVLNCPGWGLAACHAGFCIPKYLWPRWEKRWPGQPEDAVKRSLRLFVDGVMRETPPGAGDREESFWPAHFEKHFGTTAPRRSSGRETAVDVTLGTLGHGRG